MKLLHKLVEITLGQWRGGAGTLYAFCVPACGF
jgi:hypothetical protein